MENKQSIVLSKSTSAEALKTYFRNIQRMEESGEQFPVNLNEVWPIVFPRKDHAVRELQSNSIFIEGIDYIVKADGETQSKENSSETIFPKSEENKSETTVNISEDETAKTTGKGKKETRGRRADNYFLSVSCLEFFIARRVRPIFEVYRSVFRAVRQNLIPLKTPYTLPLRTVGSKVEEVAAYLRDMIISEEDGEKFPIALDNVWRLAYPSVETPLSHVLKKGQRTKDEYTEGVDYAWVTDEKSGKRKMYINTHTMLRLVMPRSLKIQCALGKLGYEMPMHELEFAPTYLPTGSNSMWFLDLIGMRQIFDMAVQKECSQILRDDYLMRREIAMSEENEDEEERERLWGKALRPMEDRQESTEIERFNPTFLPGLNSNTHTRIDPLEAVNQALVLLDRLRYTDDDETQQHRVTMAIKALILFKEDL